MFEETSKFYCDKLDEKKLEEDREKEFTSTAYIDLTRHGNRFGGPMTIKLRGDNEATVFKDTQELTPRGHRNAEEFGSAAYEGVSLVHPRGGDELRHGQSGEDILKGSGKFGEARKTASPILYKKPLKNEEGEPVLDEKTNLPKIETKLKGARQGKGMDYKSADVMAALGAAKKLINDTLQTLVDGLTDEQQLQFRSDAEFRAKLREQAQVAGLKAALEGQDEQSKTVIKILAENTANELIHDVKLSRLGVKDEKIKAVTLVGSGLFAESLFKYALVVEDPKTGDKKTGFKKVDDIGGFTKQASAFRIKLTRDNSKGDARKQEDFGKDTVAECEFIGDPERAKLFEGKKVYLNWNIVKELANKAKERFEKKLNQDMPNSNEAFLARHADKGEYTYDEVQIKNELPEKEANLIKTVLREKGLTDEVLPLKLEGLKRSVKAGEVVYDRLPKHSVLIMVDSRKPRADLTQSIISTRIAQLESKYQDDKERGKRVDMLHVDDEEFSKLMQDEGTETWSTFAAMMKAEGINENEGIARQVNTFDKTGAKIPGSESMSEAAARYKKVLTELRSRVTSENIPVVIVGIGHSGPLSVIAHQEKGSDINEVDIPQFAEMFVFDSNNKLIGREKTEI